MTNAWKRLMQSISKVLCLLLTVLMLSAFRQGNVGTDVYRHLHLLLFPDGRPIGQPLSGKCPEIRMVRVQSPHEAYRIFAGLCVFGKIDTLTFRGDKWLFCHLPGERGGYLLFNRRPRPGWREVGTVYIRSSILNVWGLKELHFIETIKIKKGNK